MCGIFGRFDPDDTLNDPQLVERMARVLAHRGPDGYGIYGCGPLVFGAGRLAIIDLSAPAGPIFNEDRSLAVVYNGEIYNYRALRQELERAGHRFSTATDTEVIVHGYEEWGDDVLERLRGMFALCVWDAHRERLLLARDRLGEKPLYYASVGSAFLFASEIKALLEHPGIRRAVDQEALLCYLALGYVAPPRTMFAGIHKLAPGEKMVVDRNTHEVARYWTPVMDTLNPLPGDYDSMVRQVREMLVECVEMRMMSDVPIGVFLSGGIDSTAVAAIVARAMSQPLQSFTVGFDYPEGSHGDLKFNVDARHGAEAARFLKAEHHSILVREDQLARLFPYLVRALDEPVAEPAIIQTAYVAALARSNGVPVLLSGDGSDELFFGYGAYRSDRVLERYLMIPHLLRAPLITPLMERLPSGRLKDARQLARKSRETDAARRYMHWYRMFAVDQLPETLVDQTLAGRAYEVVSDILHPLLAAPRAQHFAERIAFASLNLWIAEDSNMRVDKMTMAMSVEARAPFEDHHLASLALRIPMTYKLRSGDVKRVLKDAVRDLIPPAILTRPKWGFIPPASDWLRTVLKPLVDDYLSRDRIEADGLFCPDTVQTLVTGHMEHTSYQLSTLWTLLVFQLWHAMYIARDLALDGALTPADIQ